MAETPDVHELSGAYALHALDQHEAARFDRHLAGCAACREEVRTLRDAAADLGAAEPRQPPPALRRRVLAAAARTEQLGPAPRGAERPGQSPAGTADPARLRRATAWAAGAAVAAVLVVVAVLGLVVPGEPDQPAPAAAVVEVFDAPDAQTATVRTDNGGRLRVATSASRDEMAVDTAGLPALDPGRVYQLWSVSEEGTESAAVLDDPGEGAAMALPDRGVHVIVTVEPAGGSQQPTTEAIADVDPYAV